MKVLKLLLIVLLGFVMAFFDTNSNFVFFCILAISILSFIWLFWPLWIETDITYCIKHHNYFRNYKTYTFLFISIGFSWVFVTMVAIDRESGLYYYFFVLKIIFILMMNFTLFLRLLNE